MSKTPAVSLAALLLIASLTARSQAPDEMETVLVTGEQPGPGLWKVSRDGHVMWVLGSIHEVPETIAWRTNEVEARIAESKEVLYPGWPDVGLDISVFQALTLIPSVFKAAKNPDGKMLKDMLNPEDYATWIRLKKKYIDKDDDIEKYRPIVAQDKLNTAINKQDRKATKRIRSVPVNDVIKKLAKKHKVPIHTSPTVERKIKVEKPRSIIKAARNLDLAEGACVGRNLVRIERRDAAALQANEVARINAWATGDLEAVSQRSAPDPALELEDCETAALDAVMKSDAAENVTEISRGLDLFKQLEDLSKQAGAEAERKWLEAVEAALAKNDSTFAVLPFHLMTNQWVYLANLKKKGYVVEAPGEQR
jgi:hypothetical protein